LSSAEDRASSTVLPPQGSSNSTPEEFAVEAHQDSRDEPDASHSATSAPHPGDLQARDSSQPSPESPGEDAAAPLKTKPLPKVNAVAREIRVKVTGARAGGASEERDLFAESTTTVLVFEKGGVIRLTAAVTPRQLLFLTNEESKREVVTQVMRKRAHRPTECYVELEFTEPAPGFWGIQFSAATALLPKDEKLIAAAEMISSAETTDDELEEAAPPPSEAEVEALKREVEALRGQLNSLQAQAEPNTESTGTIPNAPPASPAETTSAPQPAPPHYQVERVAWAELAADAFPAESAPKPVRTAPADPAALPKPALVFRKSLPPRKGSFRARGQFTPGFRAGMLRLAILSSILAALVGTAWYKGWIPGIHQPKKIPVSSWSGGVTIPLATPPLPSSVSIGVQSKKPSLGNNQPVSVGGASSGSGLSSESPAETVSGNEKGSESVPQVVAIEKPVGRERTRPPASIAKSAPVHPLPAIATNPLPAASANAIDVPPKLIKSEKAVASLDDLRDFETGSVVIDAVIDTEGNVTSMRVLSGPPSLRWPALQALKNYRYEPALQNGRPVAAHVTVKIQFHFE
jgi:periplasmic protein TonB